MNTEKLIWIVLYGIIPIPVMIVGIVLSLVFHYNPNHLPNGDYFITTICIIGLSLSSVALYFKLVTKSDNETPNSREVKE